MARSKLLVAAYIASGLIQAFCICSRHTPSGFLGFSFYAIRCHRLSKRFFFGGGGGGNL